MFSHFDSLWPHIQSLAILFCLVLLPNVILYSHLLLLFVPFFLELFPKRNSSRIDLDILRVHGVLPTIFTIVQTCLFFVVQIFSTLQLSVPNILFVVQIHVFNQYSWIQWNTITTTNKSTSYFATLLQL